MKDYKPRPKPKKSGSVGNTLIGIFVGLLLGLLIAAAIAIYMNKATFPFAQQKPKPVPPDAKAPDAKAVAKADQKGAPRDFTFHDILTGKSEPTPRPPSKEDVPRPEPKAEPVLKDIFILQAGSFQNPAEADQRKARLALLGLEASVEPVDLPDKGTWYRVKLGPFKSLTEVNFVRSKLAQEGVDATVLKSKDQ